MQKKSLIFAIFSLIFQIFSLIFMQKNLDLIFSILDLEISIPDLENSKRAFRKKTPNLRKFYPNFRQFFAKNFTKIPKWNFRKIKVFIFKLWVMKLRVCISFFCALKTLYVWKNIYNFVSLSIEIWFSVVFFCFNFYVDKSL